MKKHVYISLLSIILLVLFVGCNKFLEEKSDKELSVPTTIEDFQAILNNINFLNLNYITAGEVSSDNYYLNDADFNALAYESDKRLYTWQGDYVTGTLGSGGDEWYNCYKSIFVCNSVLKGLEENKLTGTAADIVKGQALVFRAARYLDGVQVWAPAYSSHTAGKDLGMVLRLLPDASIPSKRSTVQQTYDLIIKDLTNAVSLLPDHRPSVTLPGKSAAYGLLARAYLFMGDYKKALQAAESALEGTTAVVIDFNNLDSNADFPIPAIKEASQETILWTAMFYANQLGQSVARIAPSLYNMYDDDDLRRVIYFDVNADGSHFFKGTHIGYFGFMNSLTVTELLLTVAECSARTGNLTKAAEALNRLLFKRWKKGSFTPYDFSSKEAALQVILEERRKELVFRGLRWPDIKRLNRDGYNITLTRNVNGNTFTLPPNDLRYAIAIPEEVIETSGITQNPR